MNQPTAPNPHRWAVGEEALLVTRERDWGAPGQPHKIATRPITITRVGRVYIYAIRYGREQAFHAAGGWEKSDFGGPSARIRTPEQHAEDMRRRDGSERLRRATAGYGWPNRLTVDQMHTLAQWIETQEPQA
jgi:hypothetical protein